jgi:hypothetical protein
VRGRQAWLNREWADWYPGIKPEAWHDAIWVRETVLAQLRHGSPRWTFRGRVLNDGHFRFQGVAPLQSAQRRMIWEDVILPNERRPMPTDDASKHAR